MPQPAFKSGDDVTALMGGTAPGNIDLYAQPVVKNPDGSTSTVDSSSYNLDGQEVLLPSVTPDGRHLSTPKDIVAEYRKTGRHLGKFSTPDEATAYAKQLHDDYAAGKYAKKPLTSGQDVTALMGGADFSSTNAKDAQGNAVVDPNTVGTFARHLGSQVNPLPLGQMIPFPQAAGGAGWDAPLQALKNIGGAHEQVAHGAKQAFDAGDYLTAGRKAIDYLLPVIGPVLDKSADAMAKGDYAAGLGDAVGLALSMFGGKPAAAAVSKLKVGIPKFTNPNAADVAAAEFGQARGVPVDAATATGNRFVRSVQAVSEHSPIGSIVAERAKAGQAAALTRVGGEIADAVHPSPVTPEQAGAAVKGGVEQVIGDLHGQASKAYDTLRQMEADPKHAQQVPVSGKGAKELEQSMARSLGHVPTPAELAEMRRIYAELDSLPFTKRTWNAAPKKSGNAAGGDYDVVGGSAGASVYNDILDLAPGTAEMTRGEVKAAVDQALNTGRFTNAAKGALDVARLRMRNATGISKPALPPSAGDLPVSTESMGMPVNLKDAKSALSPIRDRLMREKELTGVLMGEKGRALVALDALLSGPDHAPVSIVDAALGDLKAMARGASMPELRSAGQGVAAQAVKNLDAAVRQAVTKAGPEAVTALEEGRSATVAKHAAAEVLDAIKDEPVKAYRGVTAPQDSAIAHLRQVQELAPQAIPQIGRAVLEDLLGKATAEGGFDHAAKLHADWQRIGPQTKRMLFGAEQVPDLDRFFLLAKRLAEPANSSKTALVSAAAAHAGLIFTNPAIGIPVTVGSGVLAKLLHSPKGVKALTRGIAFSVSKTTVPAAVQAAAYADLVSAARAVGVDLAAMPKAADSPEGAPAK